MNFHLISSNFRVPHTRELDRSLELCVLNVYLRRKIASVQLISINKKWITHEQKVYVLGENECWLNHCKQIYKKKKKPNGKLENFEKIKRKIEKPFGHVDYISIIYVLSAPSTKIHNSIFFITKHWYMLLAFDLWSFSICNTILYTYKST